MIFDSWQTLGKVFAVGVLAYLALVFLLRVSGKRTLSKMNAFDLVVTVAIGSILATVVLDKSMALLDGLAAFVVLIFLQMALTALSVRSHRFLGLIKAEPRLLVHRGRFLTAPMQSERVAEVEILAVLRQQGVPSLELVEAVVLETNGTFSVLRAGAASYDSLKNVVGADPSVVRPGHDSPQE